MYIVDEEVPLYGIVINLKFYETTLFIYGFLCSSNTYNVHTNI